MKDANKDELWLEHAKTSVIYLFIFEWDIPKNLRKSHAQPVFPQDYNCLGHRPEQINV